MEVIDRALPTTHALNPYIDGAQRVEDAWGANEAERLSKMDEFLRAITEHDVSPYIRQLQAETTNDRAVALNMLDIGAGTGTTTEDLCQNMGVTYYALDPNPTILANRRITPEDQKILGRSEAMELPDNSFDMTHSRAVTGWSPKPRQSISEQIRVTREGGFAFFTEFDWSTAGADPECEVYADLMEAKAIMISALASAQFDPYYGSALSGHIDQVAKGADIELERREIIHDFPPGDHRQLFLDAAHNLYEAMREKSPTAGEGLQILMERIRNANSVRATLPRLVTQIVRVNRKPVSISN